MEKRYVVYEVRQERIAPDIFGPDVFIRAASYTYLEQAIEAIRIQVDDLDVGFGPKKYTIFTIYE